MNLEKLDMKYQEDLKYMINKYEEIFVAPYYCYSKIQINNYINDYLSKNSVNNDLQFLYFLKSIFKRLNGELDSHTTVKLKRNFFPFVLKILDDDMYVIKTSEGYEKFKYSKLISVNNIPWRNLINEVDNTISYSTEGWGKKYFST